MAKTARAERALAAASSGCEATRAEPHPRRPLPGAGSLAKPGQRGRAAQRWPPEKPRPAFRRTGRGGGDLTDPAPRGDCSPPRETEARSFPPPAPQYSTHHEKARKQPGLRETQTKVTLGHLDARGTNGVGTAQASMAQHKPGDTSCGGEGGGGFRQAELLLSLGFAKQESPVEDGQEDQPQKLQRRLPSCRSERKPHTDRRPGAKPPTF